MTLTPNTTEIAVGRCYACAKPSLARNGFVNDRQVLWISYNGTELQYDSPTVPNGRRYRKMAVAAFKKWAVTDVTDEMPSDGSWRTALHHMREVPASEGAK